VILGYYVHGLYDPWFYYVQPSLECT
jgi:hypothetical protein